MKLFQHGDSIWLSLENMITHLKARGKEGQNNVLIGCPVKSHRTIITINK